MHSCLQERSSSLALLEENIACLGHMQDVYVRGTGMRLRGSLGVLYSVKSLHTGLTFHYSSKTPWITNS